MDRLFTVTVMGTGAGAALLGVAGSLALTFAGESWAGSLPTVVFSTGGFTACLFVMMLLAMSAANAAHKERVAVGIVLAQLERSEAAAAHQELLEALRSRPRRWWSAP